MTTDTPAALVKISFIQVRVMTISLPEKVMIMFIQMIPITKMRKKTYISVAVMTNLPEVLQMTMLHPVPAMIQIITTKI